LLCLRNKTRTDAVVDIAAHDRMGFAEEEVLVQGLVA